MSRALFAHHQKALSTNVPSVGVQSSNKSCSQRIPTESTTGTNSDVTLALAKVRLSRFLDSIISANLGLVMVKMNDLGKDWKCVSETELVEIGGSIFNNHPRPPVVMGVFQLSNFREPICINNNTRSVSVGRTQQYTRCRKPLLLILMAVLALFLFLALERPPPEYTILCRSSTSFF